MLEIWRKEAKSIHEFIDIILNELKIKDGRGEKIFKDNRFTE